ncbi:MAG: hypothetical protein AB1601_05600 [Planctomycetota bacterium]
MAESEKLVLIVSLAAAVIGWGTWIVGLVRPTRLGRPRHARGPLALAAGLSLVLLCLVLTTFSAADVRTAPQYLLFYEVMGAAWVGLGLWLTAWMGVSTRDDAVERGNRAATWTLAGATLGLMLCFAGANIGDGPGWWVVVFCAGLATAGWYVAWLIVELGGGASELITVERDVASGLRLAGFLIGVGLVCGRAAAGDWISADAALSDFAEIAWPVAPAALAEVALCRLLPPAPQPSAAHVLAVGVIPALLYVLVAGAYISVRGPW